MKWNYQISLTSYDLHGYGWVYLCLSHLNKNESDADFYLRGYFMILVNRNTGIETNNGIEINRRTHAVQHKPIQMHNYSVAT